MIHYKGPLFDHQVLKTPGLSKLLSIKLFVARKSATEYSISLSLSAGESWEAPLGILLSDAQGVNSPLSFQQHLLPVIDGGANLCSLLAPRILYQKM